jgi:hypothetical protein
MKHACEGRVQGILYWGLVAIPIRERRVRVRVRVHVCVYVYGCVRVSICRLAGRSTCESAFVGTRTCTRARTRTRASHQRKSDTRTQTLTRVRTRAHRGGNDRKHSDETSCKKPTC